MTLEALRENKTLQTIDLNGNNIGSEGAKELAEANEQIYVCMLIRSLFVEESLPL
jgi:Ran GTPase-activating protein (RanGAP) involved in mRNA processing and transport